jgi:carboxyl-terminal processing protease
MIEKAKVAGWLTLGALAGAMVTVSVQTVANENMRPLPLDEIRQLSTVFDLIKREYVEPVDEKKLFSDAISGMVTGLDPHSQYYDKKAYKEFLEGISGRFIGVGIEIAQEDGYIKVVTPIEGSPADQAGLRAGDLITRIDGTGTRGLSINDAVKRIRGEPRTKVVLTIFRKSEEKTFPVTITRDVIRTNSVRSKVIEPSYAWIRISQFQERTVEDFFKQLLDIHAKEPALKGLVLDLRNNPGGFLDAGVAVSATFLPENVTVVSTNGQLPSTRSVYKTTPQFWRPVAGQDPVAQFHAKTKGYFKKIPLVVLVNEGSASASEIVAGALKDHKRATILGSQTFGKGSVQTTRQLTPDTGVKFTIARYYSPSGQSIQAIGIKPDVWLDETENGNVFAALRTREADLDKHLGAASSEAEKQQALEREKEREKALQALQERQKQNNGQAERPPEYGSEKDFQLQQALNQLKGRPVMASKTLSARQTEDKK